MPDLEGSTKYVLQFLGSRWASGVYRIMETYCTLCKNKNKNQPNNWNKIPYNLGLIVMIYILVLN